LGGEPSFRGQANGLWLWQSDVGGLIVDAILPPRYEDGYLFETPAIADLQRINATQELEA
jgi:hypothetical protein